MTDRASADDRQLLRRFTENNSQEAFAALTARCLNLVYSVCLREVRDPELAQEVTQAVFLLLARTAPSSAPRPPCRGGCSARSGLRLNLCLLDVRAHAEC